MNFSSSSLLKIAIAFVLVGVTVFGIRYVSASQEQPSTSVKKQQSPPGMIKFGPNAPQLSALKIAVVDEVPLPVSDLVNARITYDETVTSRITSPVLGRVMSLHAEIGDKVHRGTILVDIDSPDLATAEADWRKAQADELRKKLAYERAKMLFDAEVIARKDYETADADYLQSKAETKRAHLRMKSLNASGNENGRFGLTSPIDGIVADKQINPGLEVRPDLPNPLFTISDLSRLWVIVDLPENIAFNIHAGQLIRLETDAFPQNDHMGKVALVGLALDPATRRVQVRCVVDNKDKKLKPEMFARVSFIAEDSAKKAIPVPNTSIFADGLHSYVFVETQTGVFEKRQVSIKVKSYEKSYIDSGLSKNEKIVTEGAFLLNAEVASDAH
ncbi:MAG: efflux RND transporter periplasmic adaptor subunit [Cytophaga sp.]|nr:efflux RND transporter periplasmic adaptor subunit [Undibacterium sp.]